MEGYEGCNLAFLINFVDFGPFRTNFLLVPTLPLVRCSSIVRAKTLKGVSVMPTPTTSIDHMIYTLGEIAFYYHYYPAQRLSSSTGGRSKDGKTLSGKTRIMGADRLVMVEKVECYVILYH